MQAILISDETVTTILKTPGLSITDAEEILANTVEAGRTYYYIPQFENSAGVKTDGYALWPEDYFFVDFDVADIELVKTQFVEITHK